MLVTTRSDSERSVAARRRDLGPSGLRWLMVVDGLSLVRGKFGIESSMGVLKVKESREAKKAKNGPRIARRVLVDSPVELNGGTGKGHQC